MLSGLDVVFCLLSIRTCYPDQDGAVQRQVKAIPILEVTHVLTHRASLSGTTIRVSGILTVGAEHNALSEDGCSKFKDNDNKDWACALWLVGSSSSYVSSPPSADSELLSAAMKSRSWDVVHRFAVVLEGTLRSGDSVLLPGSKAVNPPERGYGHLNSFLAEVSVARLLSIKVLEPGR
jgi:hypothetical protein